MLIHDLHRLCQKLARRGWGDLLWHGHGLRIAHRRPGDLAAALRAPLRGVNRKLPGFEDFANIVDRDGRPVTVRGIEPGAPALSLLFHALASPRVRLDCHGQPLRYFPNLAELELVENYVYGVKPPTIAALKRRAGQLGGGSRLAVVAFAQEYRPAAQTCHGQHADMVFARTGVARVGTAGAIYHPPLRGFLPEVERDPYAIAVLPSRFAAYLAVQAPGSEKCFRPMRYRNAKAAESRTVRIPDSKRRFWVPLHKLFAGSECLRSLDLSVDFDCQHVNEKLRRIHLQLKLGEPEDPPFRFTEGIAAFSRRKADGSGLLVPKVHPRLVEPARIESGPDRGKWATFRVRAKMVSNQYSSVALEEINDDGILYRNAPQYVNAKTEVLADGTLLDIDADARYERLRKRADAGEYDALHFIDFTGDGWVQVRCPQLTDLVEPCQAAYSLVTAPDFFPRCDQRTLTAWTEQMSQQKKMQGTIWKETPPDSLSDQRYPANLALPLRPGQANPFNAKEDSITALVSLLPSPLGRSEHPQVTSREDRHVHLPDDAAGIFDPGWDVSLDHLGHGKDKTTWKPHLAAYGLGSPFPEDAKLCAALSAFWPAVSPDTTRTMEPRAANDVHTTVPLTDEEIGQLGDLPWDGVRGPRVVIHEDRQQVEFTDFHHVDYVRNALAGQFSLRLTGRIDADEYENRVLAMAAVHMALSPDETFWNDWIVLSFRVVIPDPRPGAHRPHVLGEDASEFVMAAQSLSAHDGEPWIGPVYFFDMFTRRHGKKTIAHAQVAPYDFRKRLMPLHDRRRFFVSPASQRLVEQPAGQAWKPHPFRPWHFRRRLVLAATGIASNGDSTLGEPSHAVDR